ncbi:MAG TPA: YceI family protein, partial [Lunatimonas sp.]|nr:YceI family protein [Lunatimonas sp.]
RIEGNTNLKVSGTSTLHDWDMISEQASGNAKLTVSGGNLSAIQAANFSMPAESIKSGKRQMDTNAYKALLTDKHKQVSFVMTEAKKDGNKWLISGMLELAGMKKPVTFTADTKASGNLITFTSVTSFKLTAFGVEPPTAMLGTIKTGDDVTLTVEMTLKPIL